MKKRSLFIVLLILTVAAASFAENTIKITFTNNTGYTIKEFYVSPTSHDDWYDNLLKDGDVPTGKSVDIWIPDHGTDEQVYDLMAVDAEGDSYSKYEVDLSSQENRTIEFTFDDYEGNGDTSGSMGGNDYNSGYMDGYRDAFRDAYSEAFKEGFKAGREENN